MTSNLEIPSPSELSAALKKAGLEAGFSLLGISPAVAPPGLQRFEDWLDAGYAGDLRYLTGRRKAYASVQSILPGARSVVMGAINYCSDDPQPATEGAGRVARYAWGQGDYHDWLRKRMRSVADRLHELVKPCKTRVVVDTAPLLERDFARLSGLGWFGKNTMLINKRQGSWLLLASLLTDVELAPDQPHETAHCGTCTRCLEICPTQAFPEPGVLDATKCLAYWNIEQQGDLPHEIATGLGDWLFGCDLCQEVCPWNRKAPKSSLAECQASPDLNPIDARWLLGISPEEFLARYQGTPLERPGYDGLRRNAAVVLGNQRHESARPALESAACDASPVVAAAARWALERLDENRPNAPSEPSDR